MPNKKAKDRKRKKRKMTEWLNSNGRTANQVKKKRMKEQQKRLDSI
jgi:hypothetical protein